MYKSFRKLYEAITNVSNSIYAFESDDEAFMSEKDELINRNLQICQEIPKSHFPSDNAPTDIQKNKNSSQEREINELKQEIEELHRLIEQNDE